MNAFYCLPAETGVLTPRRSRRVEPAAAPSPIIACAVNSPHHRDSPSKRSINSSPAPAQPHVAINHPLPTVASVSAKVTLQAMGLSLGDRVCVGPGGSSASAKMTTSSSTGGRMGRLRYCGPVDFASGCWVGVELDDAFGKNDGSVGGVCRLYLFLLCVNRSTHWSNDPTIKRRERWRVPSYN